MLDRKYHCTPTPEVGYCNGIRRGENNCLTRLGFPLPIFPMRSKALDALVMVLLVIGGLNWGLVAAMQYDLVANLFGDMSLVSRIIYGLVGLAAVYAIIGWL